MSNEVSLATIKAIVPAAAVFAVMEHIKRCGGVCKIDEDEWELVQPLPEATRTGKLLRAARLRADMTQKELASKIGVPQTHISQYESNKRKIPAQKAKALAELLKTSPDYFL